MAVDARRAGRIAIVVCLVALVSTALILTVAGVDKNDQIEALKTTGVPVTVTVSRCVGLLGGSGSNAAGYACRGSYDFRGKRYEEAIPGNVNRAPGSTLRGVIASGDPALLSTPGTLGAEQASWRVFLAPAALWVVAAATSGALLLRRRRRRRAAPV